MSTRIIVVHNYEIPRNLLTYNLKSRGYEVLNYDYDHIGLAALERLHPDLLILDFNARDAGRGWEFLQLLKMRDETAQILIIVTTNLQFSPELESYLRTRFIHFVNKPLDFDTFLPLVQKTLTLSSQSGVLFSSDRVLPILVVEDQKDLREAVTTILGFEGYQVITAENGLWALDAISNADHCLILLDIEMPIMDGFEFLRMYERQPRPHTPVIILSGEYGIRSRVLPSFVVDVLPKPFEMPQLLQAIEKYAQRV